MPTRKSKNRRRRGSQAGGWLTWLKRRVPGVFRRRRRRRRRRRLRGAGWRLFRSWPPSAQFATVLVVMVALWVPMNWIYQVVRKPSELFFPVSGALNKTPEQTWRTYRSLFERHSTAVIAPDLLAALAQVEGSGNPVARTYWRWARTYQLFEIYRPASSAVGMYQITDGTFSEARRYCVHDHVVVEQGAWHDWRACWFNALYTRTVPSHAIEMTSAYLDRMVHEAVALAPERSATLAQKQQLAAVIHLCGRGAGRRYARQGLRVQPGERCGSHDLAAYMTKVERMRVRFR